MPAFLSRNLVVKYNNESGI